MNPSSTRLARRLDKKHYNWQLKQINYHSCNLSLKILPRNFCSYAKFLTKYSSLNFNSFKNLRINLSLKATVINRHIRIFSTNIQYRPGHRAETGLGSYYLRELDIKSGLKLGPSPKALCLVRNTQTCSKPAPQLEARKTRSHLQVPHPPRSGNREARKGIS